MHYPRFTSPESSPEEQKQTQDAIADLQDFCRDTNNGWVSEHARATLTALDNLFYRNMTEALRPAYLGLEAMKRRNSDTFGDDLPIHHIPVYKNFRDVVDTLLYCIERDFDREWKQQLGQRR